MSWRERLLQLTEDATIVLEPQPTRAASHVMQVLLRYAHVLCHALTIGPHLHLLCFYRILRH